jgi:hypothetical protein
MKWMLLKKGLLLPLDFVEANEIVKLRIANDAPAEQKRLFGRGCSPPFSQSECLRPKQQ